MRKLTAFITFIATILGSAQCGVASATAYYRLVFVEHYSDPVELRFEHFNSFDCLEAECRWMPVPPDEANPQGLVEGFVISERSATTMTVTYTFMPYPPFSGLGPIVSEGGWNFVDRLTGELMHTLEIKSDGSTDPTIDEITQASVTFRSGRSGSPLLPLSGPTLHEGMLAHDPLVESQPNQVLFFGGVETMSAAFTFVPEPAVLSLFGVMAMIWIAWPRMRAYGMRDMLR